MVSRGWMAGPAEGRLLSGYVSVLTQHLACTALLPHCYYCADFMGACDLHLLQAPQLDLTIDIRTKIRYDYSFIESAVIRLGNDILESASLMESRAHACPR